MGYVILITKDQSINLVDFGTDPYPGLDPEFSISSTWRDGAFYTLNRITRKAVDECYEILSLSFVIIIIIWEGYRQRDNKEHSIAFWDSFGSIH